MPAKGEPDLLLSLSLQTASGGVPIVVDGQVIGAVGIGGGTGEQDVEIANARVQACSMLNKK